MSGNPNYTEWTKKQKLEFAEKRMKEMKEKNEKLLKRYTEVQQDRITAENKNSAITNFSKESKKEKKSESIKLENKQLREWDKGKKEYKDDWKSSEYEETFKNYRSGYQERRHFNRSNYDHYKYDRSNEDEKYQRERGYYKQYDDRPSSNHHRRSSKRARNNDYQSDEERRNLTHPYSYEKYKRFDYNRTNLRKKYTPNSRSSSRSESDFVANNAPLSYPNNIPITSLKVSSLWQSDEITEEKTKQMRVEKWVQSVNKSTFGSFVPDQEEKDKKSYSKFDRINYASSNESSEDGYLSKTAGKENKSRKISIASKPEYNLNKQNTDRKNKEVPKIEYTSKPEYEFHPRNSVKQRLRGSKAKRSPQDSSSSSKNYHFRKRRFDNNELMKRNLYDEKKKFGKSVMRDKDDSWENAAVENRSPKKENINFSVGSWKRTYDCWADAVNSEDDEDTWKTGQPQADDGWETAEQSDMKWQLSDEEKCSKESKNKLKKSSENNCSASSWKKNITQLDDPGNSWSHNQKNKGHLNSAATEEMSKETDGWEDSVSFTLNEISKKMQKSCKIADNPENDKGKNTGGSDGWSTCSEEGEIHSNEENADSEWKK